VSDEPDVRTRLLEAAARLLGEEGPAALSTRRLAAEAETSTMAVYTHFGGMPALVREIVVEGFARLFARVEAVEPSGDPLEDLRRFAVAYRDNALDNPYLYAVMFGSASLGGYRLHDDDLAIGLGAFGQLVEATKRAIQAGALRQSDPTALAGQLWVALHGYVLLEHTGYHHVVDDPENEVLWPMLANILFAYLPDPAQDES
jgi:AcrR family transcriptional regulator